MLVGLDEIFYLNFYQLNAKIEFKLKAFVNLGKNLITFHHLFLLIHYLYYNQSYF